MLLLELDPNTVKAGWLPLGLVVLLFVLIIVGYLSMRRQISKITVPTREELAEADRATDSE